MSVNKRKYIKSKYISVASTMSPEPKEELPIITMQPMIVTPKEKEKTRFQIRATGRDDTAVGIKIELRRHASALQA